MTTYAKAWLIVAAALSLLIGLFVLWGFLEAQIGSSAGLLVVAIWLAGGIALQRTVSCPNCGTSPYLFGPRPMWAKPWPNTRCGKCGQNLRAT